MYVTAASIWLESTSWVMLFLLPFWCLLLFMALIRWVKKPGTPSKERGFDVAERQRDD